MTSRYLDLAKQALAERRQAKGGCRVLGGKTVAEVVRESARAVWFRDEHGAAWRYVHRWGIASPVGESINTAATALAGAEKDLDDPAS
jgi:hypothetical protein